jgi:hypothetical protein
MNKINQLIFGIQIYKYLVIQQMWFENIFEGINC